MQLIPWPRRLKDLGRHSARTTRDLSNGWCTIPAGTMGVVTGTSTWKRLHFIGRACPGCGVQVKISKLDRSCLELVAA